jgi:hypothetical protein
MNTHPVLLGSKGVSTGVALRQRVQHFHPHIEHNLAWRDADNFFDAFDNAYGRRVRRRVWVMTDLRALPALEKWPGLQAVIAVETIRMVPPPLQCRIDALRQRQDSEEDTAG